MAFSTKNSRASSIQPPEYTRTGTLVLQTEQCANIQKTQAACSALEAKGSFSMATVAVRDARSSSIRHGLPASFKREGVVYAIAFDMDIDQLRVHYGDPYNNAYI